jgi:dihydroorotate dehydrogenase (NAD+) catalytic subunit
MLSKNSLNLQNPIIIGSGGFSWEDTDRYPKDLSLVGAVVTKAVTTTERLGGDPPRIRQVDAYNFINRTQLKNPGVVEFTKSYLPTMISWGVPIIVNVAAQYITDFEMVAQTLAPFKESIRAIEANVSCPNVADGQQFQYKIQFVITALRKFWDGPIWLKMGFSPNLITECTTAEREGVEAVTLLNSLPGLEIINREQSLFYPGGLSGKIMKPVALRCVYEATKQLRIPVIGMGGVFSPEDVRDYLAVGASAIQLASACLLDPDIPVRLAKETYSWICNA